MIRSGREILIPVKENGKDKYEYERELSFLDSILNETEDLENLMIAYDLIDTFKRKLFTNGRKLRKRLSLSEEVPFLFLCNLN